MRLWIMSDLHLEFGPLELPPVRADVVILAGDVHLGVRGLAWVQDRWPNLPVVYVPGNHEYYGEAMPRLTEKLRAGPRPARCPCCMMTSWSWAGSLSWGPPCGPISACGGPGAGPRGGGEVMNDYRRIRVSPSYRRLQPGDTAAHHRRSRAWLEARLAEPAPGRWWR